MNWRMVGKYFGRLLGSVAVLGIIASMAIAGEQETDSTADVETIGLFQAMEDGVIEVKFIPRNAERGTVIITNKTSKELHVALPAAFAGVPLAQFNIAGNGFNNGFNRGNNGLNGGNNSLNGGGNQAFGGGFNNGGNSFNGGNGFNGGNNGFNGGIFNVMPEKVQKIKVQGVCLDHGLNDPKPKIPYELKPIESYTTKPGVADICAMMARGEISQHEAQAAAWHLNNDMSWKTLADKKIQHLVNAPTPYFSQSEIETAKEAAEAAKEREKDRAKQKSSTVVSLSDQ